jgi:hypothetical protein
MRFLCKAAQVGRRREKEVWRRKCAELDILALWEREVCMGVWKRVRVLREEWVKKVRGRPWGGPCREWASARRMWW